MAMNPTPMDVFGPSAASAGGVGGLAGELFQGVPPPLPDPRLSLPLDQQMQGSIQPQQDKPRPIDKLRPNSELHKKTLAKLDAMLKFSMDEMSKNHNRWNFMERKVQAFVLDQDYEMLVNSLNQSQGLPPEPVQVTVPYTYATLHAANTYINSVLYSRKPIFGLTATRNTSVDNARHMESALQYNIERSGGHELLWQNGWDSLLYSFGTCRIGWEETSGPIMRMRGKERVFDNGLIFSGNTLSAVDVYDCFPDPRVPLHKCSEKGDFFFTRLRVSKMVLKDMEKAKSLKYVDEALDKVKGLLMGGPGEDSQRRIRIGLASSKWLEPKDVTGFSMCYEGTVRLVPKDWGLGEEDTSQLWKFTWTKNGQIMQAEPLNMMHGRHPYVSQEPNSFGYDFMSLSAGEMITVFQDILSWLVSSRMENVRTAINNSFVVDPARVEINDIRSSTIGRIIRMKQAAMGLPIQEAIQQLVVQDVTGGHLADIQTMRMLADTVTGVNDNLRGIQTQGGRRSATEARMSMQAGATRLSQLAIRVSSQYLAPMANQMIMNIQQFMPPEMWIEVTGDTGQVASMEVEPEMLAGSFNYQVSDGSLPMDKAALTEVWKEILFGMAQDPELRQRFSMVEVFKYVAELGGAKNIDSFEVKQQQQPVPQIAAPGEEPGGTPIGTAVPALPNGQVF